jgi:abhydrolase domain-containing protein 12
MPWVETEELFKSTLKAAMEAASPRDGIPKNIKVVDLGEAGRQEVWQSGSKCIQKTIAKHGGKQIPFQISDPGSRMRSLGPSKLYAILQSRSGSSLLDDNDWPF